MKILNVLLFVGAILLLSTCSKPQIEEGVSLESTSINDPSLTDPADYLISVHDSSLHDGMLLDSLLKMPTVVAFHGFSASTFEWLEFHNYCDSVGNARVSLPLLGGHGRDYADFKKATWRDWQAGPLAEYKALADNGYTNLDITCSSTGCPLVVDALATGWFKKRTAPRRIIMIDPIILSSAKDLSLIDLVGPVIGNVQTDCTEIEKQHWYCNRPQEALNQLMTLLDRVVSQLQDGVTAPAGTQIVVYKSKRDGSADPESALLLYKGLYLANHAKIDVRIVDSDKHVFIRGAGRASWSTADSILQFKTFAEMDSMFTH